MMIDSPQPRWQHSSACRIVWTLPMHSNEKSRAAAGEIDDRLHDLVAADLVGVDEMRHAELLGDSLARRIEIDADDLVGADHARALDHVEPDAAEPEDDDIGARPDFRGVDDGADAGGDAAADVADLVERRVLAHLGDRDLRQHGEVGEGRAAHVVEHLAALAGEAARAVGHHALPLGGADRRCRGWSGATGRFCTGGIPACRAE